MIKLHLKDQALFRQQCYINGEWVDADDGDTFDVTNPSSGSVIGTVPKLGSVETARAKLYSFRLLNLSIRRNICRKTKLRKLVFRVT